MNFSCGDGLIPFTAGSAPMLLEGGVQPTPPAADSALGAALGARNASREDSGVPRLFTRASHVFVVSPRADATSAQRCASAATAVGRARRQRCGTQRCPSRPCRRCSRRAAGGAGAARGFEHAMPGWRRSVVCPDVRSPQRRKLNASAAAQPPLPVAVQARGGDGRHSPLVTSAPLSQF